MSEDDKAAVIIRQNGDQQYCDGLPAYRPKPSETALSQMMRQDRRYMRVQGLVYRIVDLTLKQLHNEAEYREMGREDYYELKDLVRRVVERGATEALMEAGVQIVTDHDRQEAGLPARGKDGWTADEIIAMEKRMIEAMYAPMPPIIIADKSALMSDKD